MRIKAKYALLSTCKLIHHEALPLVRDQAKRISELQAKVAELNAQVFEKKLKIASTM